MALKRCNHLLLIGLIVITSFLPGVTPVWATDSDTPPSFDTGPTGLHRLYRPEFGETAWWQQWNVNADTINENLPFRRSSTRRPDTSIDHIILGETDTRRWMIYDDDSGTWLEMGRYSHQTLTDAPSDSHHTRPSAGNQIDDNSNTFDVDEGDGSDLVADTSFHIETGTESGQPNSEESTDTIVVANASSDTKIISFSDNYSVASMTVGVDTPTTDPDVVASWASWTRTGGAIDGFVVRASNTSGGQVEVIFRWNVFGVVE